MKINIEDEIKNINTDLEKAGKWNKYHGIKDAKDGRKAHIWSIDDPWNDEHKTEGRIFLYLDTGEKTVGCKHTHCKVRAYYEFLEKIQADLSRIIYEKALRKTNPNNTKMGDDKSEQLPAICNYYEISQDPPELKPELIEGVLRRSHKMCITGGSKSGKSFLLLNLALSLASGSFWLRFKCKQSKVLYINNEIDSASLYERIRKISKELQTKTEALQRLDIWNLRGSGLTLEELTPAIISRCNGQNYDCIIIDPLYKVLTGDENSARDTAVFVGYMDMIAKELECAIIYAHHHTKGGQGFKDAIDRGSGSGVFSRDADAIIDMSEIDPSSVGIVLDTGVTAYRVSGILREFRSFQPFEIVFDFPLHSVKYGLERAEIARSGSARAASAANQAKTEQRKEKRENEIFRIVKKYKEENGDFPTVKQLCVLLDKSDKTVRNWIEEAEQSGKIGRVKERVVTVETMGL